jgi:hypothetical protein
MRRTSDPTNRTRARVFVGAIAATLAACVALVPLAFGGAGTSNPVLLTFEGAHYVDSTLPGGLRHDGRFTASAPFCSAGRAYDTRHLDGGGGFLTVHRLHTCDDGSGSFTVFMPTVRNEHGGTGTWQIVEGTGRYATLRGRGTYTSTIVSGDRDVFETIAYTTSWQGAVGFDADPPAIDRLVATARKVRQRPRTYVLRVDLTARDATAPVEYTVDVVAGRTRLDFKSGSTTSGQATVTFRLRPPRGARSLRVALTARDAVGNETTASHSTRLR